MLTGASSPSIVALTSTSGLFLLQIGHLVRMVRISIPTLPKLLTPYLNPHASFSLQDASSKLATFLRDGNGRTLVITGAGVSVDSGIRAYRGEDG